MVCLAFDELRHYLKLHLYIFMSAYRYGSELKCCPTSRPNWQNVAEQQMLPGNV